MKQEFSFFEKGGRNVQLRVLWPKDEFSIAPDKRVYLHKNFLISQQKCVVGTH